MALVLLRVSKNVLEYAVHLYSGLNNTIAKKRANFTRRTIFCNLVIYVILT